MLALKDPSIKHSEHAAHQPGLDVQLAYQSSSTATNLHAATGWRQLESHTCAQ